MTPKSRLIKKCDVLFSKRIRERDIRCQKCGAKATQVSHVFSRSNHSLRFDMLNGLGMDYFCHIYWWHRNPAEAITWFQKKFPEHWKYLVAKKKLPLKSLGIEHYKRIYKTLNK